ncbi:ninein-like protein isoform X3 [Clytia hemisphaerica]|uniref:EF-hand domain-containing protein n=1 Tax=Clytia hemisphaerica TaxID=252671 RepID=A0A7M6DMH5_9CNID
MGDEDDVYAEQLKEVFKSCDLDNKGYINRNELIDLSQKLQLGDQVGDLLKEILGDEFTDGKVTFEDFREGFVNVLANAIDCLGDEETEDQSEWSEAGNRLSTITATTDKDRQKVSPAHHAKVSKTQSGEVKPSQQPPQQHVKAQKTWSNTSLSQSFEAGGDESAIQMRQIWDDLAVGESGYINLLQLSIVCEHIGMEGMADDELEALFTELDKNGDGLVSLREFMDGLFLSTKRPRSDRSMFSPRSEKSVISPKNETLVVSSRNSEQSLVNLAPVNEVKLEGSLETLVDMENDLETPRMEEVLEAEVVEETFSSPPSSLAKRKSLEMAASNPDLSSTDIFYSLDPNDTGKISYNDLIMYLKENNLEELEIIAKVLRKDGQGKIKNRDLSLQLEKLVFQQQHDALTKSVLLVYKKEIAKLREEAMRSRDQMEDLKNQSELLDEHNQTLAKENEEQIKMALEESQNRIREQEANFEERLATREHELLRQRDVMLKEHEKEKNELRQRLDEIKSDDSKTKNKLKEAAMEISKLEENLNITISELNEERKQSSRLQEVAQSEKVLKQRIIDLDSQLTSLADLRTNQKERIQQLEGINKTLQRQNEEHESQIMELQNELNHKQKELDEQVQNSIPRMTRDGSNLSDYMKPELAQSNNQEMEELQSQIQDQNDIIKNLRNELDTVTHSMNEKHGREINRLTDKYASEIAELQMSLSAERTENTEKRSTEKSSLIEYYEDQMTELKKTFDKEKENLLNSHQHEQKRWQSERIPSGDFHSRERWEDLFHVEKEEIELKYKREITLLEEKIMVLETEKAELELKFLNEKSEIEQQFRIERSELLQNASSASQENEHFQKHVQALKDEHAKRQSNALRDAKDEHKREKEKLREKFESELDKMRSEYEKELNGERKEHSGQLNVQTTAAATEKSRCLREIQELKDQLLRANASSDRDNALKDKVFNDAKAEVMNLNKKLDQKSKKINSLEESLQQMEGDLFELDSERKQLDEQVQHWKNEATENKEKVRQERKNSTTKSVRSDTLVTELYVENADLMKQIANAESNHSKAEKQVRQLTDQKRALQRVISKLCNSYGITNLS